MLGDATTYGRTAMRRHQQALAAFDREQTIAVHLERASAASEEPIPGNLLESLKPRLGAARPEHPSRGATWVVLAAWPHPDLEPYVPPETMTAPAAAVHVRVNHGRWVADCPCGGAQLACRTDHRLFCVDCLNAHTHGAWVPVIWPDDPDGIGELLGSRPVGLQNWEPGESLDRLEAENKILLLNGGVPPT